MKKPIFIISLNAKLILKINLTSCLYQNAVCCDTYFIYINIDR